MKKSSKKENIIVEEELNEEVETVSDKEERPNKVVNFVKSLIPYVIIFVVIVLIRTFLITPIVVSGPSMKPTLKGGELMILNKLGDFERFDVVVVDIGYEEIIKRVIAMPGETIACEKGIIYVNGKMQEDKYGSGVTFDFEKVTLAEDEYFVMGDNRQDSKDSRHIGPVKKDAIKGTTSLVLFPFSSFGNIE